MPNVAENSDASVVDQYVQPAKLPVHELEQLAYLVMVSNIGSFTLDFTGSFLSQLGDGAIHCFLPLTTYRNRRSFC